MRRHLPPMSLAVLFGCPQSRDTGEYVEVKHYDTGQYLDTGPEPVLVEGPGYTVFEGYEQWDYGVPHERPYEYWCQLRWETEGVFWEEWYDDECPDCEFVIDITGHFLPEESQGTPRCDQLDQTYGLYEDFTNTYAVGSYYGYDYLMVAAYHGAVFYPWTPYFGLDEEGFWYANGYRDYYYDGSRGYGYYDYIGYWTSYTYGLAQIR